MHMCIDQAGNDPLPFPVDDLCVLRDLNLIASTDISNAGSVDDDGPIPDRRTAGPVDDRGALNGNDAARPLLCAGYGSEKQTDEDNQNGANLPRIHVCLPRAESESPSAP